MLPGFAAASGPDGNRPGDDSWHKATGVGGIGKLTPRPTAFGIWNHQSLGKRLSLEAIGWIAVLGGASPEAREGFLLQSSRFV
jgi:hypothetical protein